jgi:hypothetical protein
VPNFLAMAVASLLAWLVEHSLPALPGTGIPAILGFLVWIVSFHLAKRHLSELRPGP